MIILTNIHLFFQNTSYLVLYIHQIHYYFKLNLLLFCSNQRLIMISHMISTYDLISHGQENYKNSIPSVLFYLTLDTVLKRKKYISNL